MIITVDEFKEMGFSSKNDALTADCIKRAEYVLNGLSGGRAVPVAQTGGEAAEFVKQACAFQANAILREETAVREQESQSNGESESSKNDERVTIGDFTYTNSSSSSSSTKNSSKTASAFIQPLDTNFTVIRLLRAAGCLYMGAEVRE